MPHDTLNFSPPESDTGNKSLPLLKLTNRQVRSLYGYHPESKKQGLYPIDRVVQHWGNYLASFTMRQRRRVRRNLNASRFSLHGFWDLPMDVIFEILGWLHPIELYNVMRTSKDIRRTLLHRNSTSVWRASYRNHPDIPNLPPDLSDYPWWTTFIFGPDICQQCGCLGAIPNFCFRWRLCDDCTYIRCSPTETLTLPEKFHRRYPVLRFERLLLAILPVSRQTHAMQLTRLYRRREFKSRVSEITLRLKQINDESGITSFMDMCIQQTEGKLLRMKDIERAEQWAERLWDLSRGQYSIDTSRTVKRWKARLAKEYPHCLANCLSQTIRELTERDHLRFSAKVYWRYLSELNPSDDECYNADAYLMSPIANFEYSCMGVFNERLSLDDGCLRRRLAGWGRLLLLKLGFQDDDPTSEWSMTLSELRKDVIPPATKARILGFVDEWLVLEKKKLLAALAGTECRKNCKLPGGEQDAIHLACAAFTCVAHSYHDSRWPIKINTFFGWGQAHEHLGCVDSSAPRHRAPLCDLSTHMKFDPGASRATVRLLEGLGLDPSTTLCTDLDRLEPLFICMTCPEEKGKFRSKGRLPMHWRDSVLHVFEHWKGSLKSGDEYGDVCLARLDESAQQIARTHSKSHDFLYRYNPQPFKAWMCCRCFTQCRTRRELRYHLKLAHEIIQPVQFEDFFMLPTNIIRQRPSANAFRLSCSRQHTCLRCPESRQSKLWALRDLKKHLRDFHGVLDAVSGEDYAFIQLYTTEIRFSHSSIAEQA